MRGIRHRFRYAGAVDKLMRILGYNILKSACGREALVAEVIQAYQPDIVMIAEGADPDCVQRIADIADYPIVVSQPGCSTACLSRIPIDFSWQKTGLSRAPFLVIQPDNSDLQIVGVHFFSNLAGIAEQLRLREVRALLKCTAQFSETPHLLIGDFNTVVPDDTPDVSSYPLWLKLTVFFNGGGVPRQALRKLIQAGYTDTFRHFHPDDPGYSIPTPSPNTRLDYIFASSSCLPMIQNSQILRQPDVILQASDHYPTLVDLII
ncbi:MAG: endonuclease/exonuclease/phosphatase family protein [Aggregatilineales bacterium]